MNEFMFELKEMKTFDFWHKFLENELQFQRKTTRETTEERQKRDERRQQMETTFDLNRLSFSNSAFFDPKTHPTITDQVVMCRQIAKQLVCDESNAKSKGREMFEKRVQKSSKWVTTADDTTDDASEQSFHETTISEGPPNLRLLLDPRHVQDLNSLSFEFNEQKETEMKERAEEIVHDLHSPTVNPNKGNVLFAKRQQKSDEWVVKDAIVDDRSSREQTTALQQQSHTYLQYSAPTAPTPTALEKRGANNVFSRSFRDFNSRAKPFSRMY